MGIFREKSVLDTPLKDNVKVKYRGRGRSGLGTMAVGVGVIGWILFVAMIHFVRTGLIPLSRGAFLALFDMILGMLGLVLSGRGLRENNVYYVTALIGAILNGFLVVTYLVLYLIGTVLN